MMHPNAAVTGVQAGARTATVAGAISSRLRPAVTQRHYARRGEITAEMRFAALREGVDPEVVREELAAGRAILPANVNHPESEPMVIGKRFLVKVNANIGNSAVTSSVAEEVDKLSWATRWGADTVMDLSTGPDIHTTREWIIRNSPVPIGTVPIYQALEKTDGRPEELTWELYRDTLIEQAEQGVDYFTVHAGVLLRYVPLTARRMTGIVSRGGSIMAAWCLAHHQENFLYTHFEEMCEIMAAYDVAFSLGDGLRPGSIADANDEAQLAELAHPGRADRGGLAPRRPGDDRRTRSRAAAQDRRERHAPAGAVPRSALLHPRAVDRSTSRRAMTTSPRPSVRRSSACTARPCSATSPPKNIWAYPTATTSRQGMIAYKIAAHAADWPRDTPERRHGTTPCPRPASSSAGRTSSTWPSTPTPPAATTTRRCRPEPAKTAHFCSMCGPKFCSMRISQDVRDYAAANGLTEETVLTEGMTKKSSEFLRAGATVFLTTRDSKGR